MYDSHRWSVTLRVERGNTFSTARRAQGTGHLVLCDDHSNAFQIEHNCSFPVTRLQMSNLSEVMFKERAKLLKGNLSKGHISRVRVLQVTLII